jgi:hypothetical protein
VSRRAVIYCRVSTTGAVIAAHPMVSAACSWNRMAHATAALLLGGQAT